MEKMSDPGRNDPCPCGSGKKFKKCCLFNAQTIEDFVIQTPYVINHATNAMNVAHPSVHLLQAVALHQAGRLDEAEATYQALLRKNSLDSDALHYLGLIAFQRSRYSDAINLIESAIKINPGVPAYHCNLGNAFKAFGQLDSSIAAFIEAIRLDPRFQAAHSNLGNTLKNQGKLDEAVASHRKALVLNPNFAEAHNNLAGALRDQGKLDEAASGYRTAISLKPDYADAYSNLGAVLHEQGKMDEALTNCRMAISLNPDYADAYNNLGNTLAKLNRYNEASWHYQKALSLKPDLPFAFGQYLHCKMHCCDWEGIDDAFHKLLGEIDSGNAVCIPFSLQAIPSTPTQQKRVAEIFVQEKYPEIQNVSGITQRYSHDKIRLGYFSADFHDHPVAKLTAELFELHDRSRFEVIGFSCGIPQSDPMRLRLSAAFDRFINVGNYSSQKIAALARNLEIDIAIDLTGHTANSRTDIFALRPAPIQVNYLGYPGTMGAPYMDYLIADQTLIPVEDQSHYTEKIAYLPDTYMANGSHRQISDRLFTRYEVGLPDDGFVFCCFNNNYKISPAVFNIWMQLLKQVEGSVLWLQEGNTQVKQNLANEAQKHGVAPERLIFAKRMDSLSDHLERYRQANLFLDTFYFNAHTTASDALWAGLPVLTCLGDTFAGRVAASLLHALGLTELIVHSHEEYAELALALATNPDRLASIKQKLAANRTTHPLFNTVLFTRNIEDAYQQMWQRHEDALLPDHISVHG